jgi:hypothetical protein
MLRLIKFSLLAISLMFVVGCVLLPEKTAAVTAADWRAGNIIDDGVFYDKASMSVSDIQNFLNNKVPVCDTWGTKTSEYGGGTRAQYAASRGWQAPPYTCLKDFSQNGKSAAQIIKEAADAYTISPKSLLVLLQKEQTLVTDDWPLNIQYRSATGYGCPDTAPCDAEYYGFYNQVTKAAFQFRRYATYPNEYRYKPLQNNTIQYNPNAACGSSTVYIANYATAGLYNYTPYQPNASALANLYGSGDGCGAYGNRNFWRLFNDWFGTTRNADYAWSFQGQAVYTSSDKVTPVDAFSQALEPNTRYYFSFSALNTGNVTWTQNSVRVGTFKPADRSSQIYDSTWLGPARPGGMVESSVAPGQVGHFEFWFKTPNGWLDSKEYFNLVVEGVTWMNDLGLNLVMNRPRYTWQYQGQTAYTGSDKTTPVDTFSNALSPNTRYYFVVSAKNTGNVTWRQGVVRLGTAWPGDRNSQIYDSSWLTNARPATLTESTVAPGETGNFEFWINAPNGWLASREYFNLLAEGLIWMNDPGMHWIMNAPRYSWQYQGQAVYTNHTKTIPVTTMAPNTRYYFVLTAKNTGNVTWQQNTVRLGTNKPGDRNSQIYDSSWLTNARPTALAESSVAPGSNGTFQFYGTTPSSPVNVNEYFNLLAEGLIWMNDPGMHWIINTNN